MSLLTRRAFLAAAITAVLTQQAHARRRPVRSSAVTLTCSPALFSYPTLVG